jgi:hypothetical protein
MAVEGGDEEQIGVQRDVATAQVVLLRFSSQNDAAITTHTVLLTSRPKRSY